MLEKILDILLGIAGLMLAPIKAIMSGLLDWAIGLAGLPATIPAPILAALHSAATIIDSIMPLHYFVAGVGILGTLWLLWVAWKVTVVVVHFGMRIVDWALSTGGVILDSIIAGVGAMFGV
jgi:hypothetical protein